MGEKSGSPRGDLGKKSDAFSGPPRWVKVSAIIAVVLLLVVVAVMVLSGGEHGPGRHGLGLGSQESNISPVSRDVTPAPLAFIGVA